MYYIELIMYMLYQSKMGFTPIRTQLLTLIIKVNI